MLEDVGSTKMVLGGSWGHVLTFGGRLVPQTPPGCTLAGSWVAGWRLGGPGGAQDGREASEMYARNAGELGGGRAVKPIASFPETLRPEGLKT